VGRERPFVAARRVWYPIRGRRTADHQPPCGWERVLAEEKSVGQRWPFRLAFVLIAAILIGMAVVLPLALSSVIDEIFNPTESDVYSLPIAPGVPPASTNARLHISVVDLDEARLLATLRVSGHLVCQEACGFADRVVLFSLGTNEALTAGMPPSAAINLSTTERVITDTITLPLRGNPSRYPFDTYDMVLAVGMARVYPDGTIQALTRDEAAGQLFITLQEQLPRENMAAPIPLDPDSAADADDFLQYLVLESLHFERPLHARVIAVLLVVLIAAAAAYAVFMRPLHDLVINSGALVLGVWGIRAILTPGTAYRTIVDLALSAVILFLLGAITVRALQFCYARGEIPLLPWQKRPPAHDLPGADDDS